MPSSPHHKRHRSLPYFTANKTADGQSDDQQRPSPPQSPIATLLSPTTTVGKAGGKIVQSILRRVNPGSRRPSGEGPSVLGIPSNITSPSISNYTTPANTVPNTPAIPNLPLGSPREPDEPPRQSSPTRAALQRADTADVRGRVRWRDDELLSPRSKSASDAMKAEPLNEDEEGIDDAERLGRSYRNLKQRETQMRMLVAQLEQTAAEYRRVVGRLENVVEARASNANHAFRLVKAALDKHGNLSQSRAPHLADDAQRLSYGFDQLGMKMDELNGDVSSLSAQVHSTQRKLPRGVGTHTLTPRQRSWMQWWRSWADYWGTDHIDRRERDEAWRLASTSESWS